MFSIIPYPAELEIISVKGGNTTMRWEPCRVIGITTDQDGEPGYIVETRSKGGLFALSVEGYIRKPATSA
jgi:hypothetical protein